MAKSILDRIMKKAKVASERERKMRRKIRRVTGTKEVLY